VVTGLALTESCRVGAASNLKRPFFGRRGERKTLRNMLSMRQTPKPAIMTENFFLLAFLHVWMMADFWKYAFTSFTSLRSL